MNAPVPIPPAALRDSISVGTRRVRAILIPLLLMSATVATYWPILFSGFVGLDDHATVYENWNLTHLSAETFYSFWTTPQRDLYAPLTYTLFAGISLLARIKPTAGEALAIPFHAWPFHAASLVLHVLAELVVYRLLGRLIGSAWPAAAGALLFALHPVQVETVAWVTETNGLLCGLLALTAVLLYLWAVDAYPATDIFPSSPGPAFRQRRRWGNYALATEVFLLAMLSKPLGVIVPALAIVLLWLVWQTPNRDGNIPVRPVSLASGFRAALGILAIWLLMAVPFVMIVRHSQRTFDCGPLVPWRLRPFVAGDAVAFYLFKLVWPLALTPDYGRSPTAVIAQGWIWYTWVLPAVLAGGLLQLYRRRHGLPVVAGALWFLAGLLPVLGFTPHPFQPMSTAADRYLYLPMFGVALCAAWGLDRLAKSTTARAVNSRRTTLGIVMACIVLLAVLGVRTWFQCHYWHDRKSLFDHSIKLIGREPGRREGG